MLLALYFGGRVLTDGGAGSSAGDLRLALIHILMATYSLFAYSYLLSTTNKAVNDLEPVLAQQDDWQPIRQGARWPGYLGLVFAVLFGLLTYLYGTEITTQDTDPWDWAHTNYDSRWMRVIGPFFAVFTSCFLYVMIA